VSKLTAAEVCRSGRTARTWNHETHKVELDTEKEELRLKFSLSSKGGGITDVKVTIGADDFSTLVTAMASAARSRALEVMAAILASELAKQSEFDTEIVQNARQSVVEAAEQAFREAPAGRDHAERLTRDVVQQLVEQLNEKDSSESAENSAA